MSIIIRYPADYSRQAGFEYYSADLKMQFRKMVEKLKAGKVLQANTRPYFTGQFSIK